MFVDHFEQGSSVSTNVLYMMKFPSEDLKVLLVRKAGLEILV